MSAAPLKIRRERQLIRSIGSGSNAVTEDMRRFENVEGHLRIYSWTVYNCCMLKIEQFNSG